MNRTFTGLSVTSTPKEQNIKFVSTTDISLAELAIREVNRYFENLNVNKEDLLQRFEQNRGEAFERFYGSMDTNRP